MISTVKVKIGRKTFKFRKVTQYSIVHDLDSGWTTYKFNSGRSQKTLKVPTASIIWFRED